MELLSSIPATDDLDCERQLSTVTEHLKSRRVISVAFETALCGQCFMARAKCLIFPLLGLPWPKSRMCLASNHRSPHDCFTE